MHYEGIYSQKKLEAEWRKEDRRIALGMASILGAYTLFCFGVGALIG